MTTNKKEPLVLIKPAYDRHISVDESIHTALSNDAFSLYMVFRFEADFRREESDIKRSAEFLYTKAKIKKTRYYACLNELESHGLVLRDPENKLGERCVFHVARELNYFTDPVRLTNRGVRLTDTDQYSLSSNINITSDNSSKTKKQNELIEQIKEVYHEELPHLPKIRKVDRLYRRQLIQMIDNWPDYQHEGKDFTIESFRNYLQVLKSSYKWLLEPYLTDKGNPVKCTLRKLTRENTLTKIVNGEFSAD